MSWIVRLKAKGESASEWHLWAVALLETTLTEQFCSILRFSCRLRTVAMVKRRTTIFYREDSICRFNPDSYNYKAFGHRSLQQRLLLTSRWFSKCQQDVVFLRDGRGRGRVGEGERRGKERELNDAGSWLINLIGVIRANQNLDK